MFCYGQMSIMYFSYTVLSQTDVSEVLKYVWDFRAKWKYIRLELSIDLGMLETIEMENSKCEDCLRAMLIQWLRNPKAPPTWTTLDKALLSKMIGGTFSELHYFLCMLV